MTEVENLIVESSRVPINVKTKDAKPSSKTRLAPKKVAEAKSTAIELLEKATSGSKEDISMMEARLTRGEVSPRAVYEAFEVLQDAIGGRKALAELLQHCPDNSLAYAGITRLMADPDFLRGNDETTTYALDVLARRAKLPFNAMVTAFRDAKVAKMAIETLLKASTAVPLIVEQITEDASNRLVTCSLCDGKARIPVIQHGEFLLDDHSDVVTQICHACRGKGSTFEKHDIQNRKLLLDLAGLSKDKPLIQQNFEQHADVSVNFTPGDGGYEKVMQAVDKIMKVDDVIEAEIIDG